MLGMVGQAGDLRVSVSDEVATAIASAWLRTGQRRTHHQAFVGDRDTMFRGGIRGGITV
jgi:hypothetical protein